MKKGKSYAHQNTQHAFSFDGTRILVVEDDEESGFALCHSLEGKGIKTTLVSSVDEAIAIWSVNLFDVIVSDIRLGELSGIDLLSYIRKEAPAFPVILITGFADLETAIAAVRLGADDFIIKPFDTIADLLAPINRAVARKKQAEQLLLSCGFQALSKINITCESCGAINTVQLCQEHKSLQPLAMTDAALTRNN